MTNTISNACNITTGKLDSNQAVNGGIYPFFTCSELPGEIDHYAFDDDVVLVAGNNAQGNFHVSRFKGKFNAYQRTYILTARPNINIDYIYYALKLELKRLREKSQGSQTKFLTMPILNSIQLRSLCFQEQTNIANTLKVIDKKIELNNRTNSQLEAMAKTLYDYWFVQFDFPDANGKPYKTSGGNMVYNPTLKREIPEGWSVLNLFEAMDIQYGFPFNTSKFIEKDSGYPIARIRDVLNNSISCYTTELADQKYLLKRNDLLVAMDGNFHVNFWSKSGVYLNQRTVRIRDKSNSLVSIFQAYFELKPHIKSREKNVSRTTVGHLSDKDLKRLFLLSPNLTNSFNPKARFDSLLNKMMLNRLENESLTNYRNWLLPMSMIGQVTIKC